MFPTSRARLTRCSPDIPEKFQAAAFQRMGGEYAASEYTFPPSPTAPDLACTVRFLGINWGGLAKKQEKMAALSTLTDPDILCLQEVWEAAYLDCLRLLPYRQFRSVNFQRGGLAILVHLRWLGKLKPKVSPNEHWMGFTVKRSTADSLAVVNVHFPPGMHPKAKNTAVKESAEFLLNEKCTAHILQGDINADDTTSWFRQAKKKGKPWSGLVCPYESGSPTNRVKKGYRYASTMRGWMLISTSTPCKKCEWVILRGLSSHFALLFEMHFDAQYFRPADPTCRQFNFIPTSQNALAQAAALVSVGLYWCTGAPMAAKCSAIFILGPYKTVCA